MTSSQIVLGNRGQVMFFRSKRRTARPALEKNNLSPISASCPSLRFHASTYRLPPNNRFQRTALRAAHRQERWADETEATHDT